MSKLSHEILLALAYVSQISDPDSARSRFIESLSGLDEGFIFEFVERLPPGIPEYRILPIATSRSSFGYAVMAEGPETSEAGRAVFRNAFKFLAVLLENRIQARALKSRNESLLKEINQEKSLLRTVLDTLPVGVWVADGKGTILMGNPAGKRIWGGVRYTDIDQYNEYKAWWSDTGKRIASHEWGMARAITTGEISIDEEIDIKCFNGTHKTILNSSAPLFDDAQGVIGAVSVNRDITERKRAEKVLQTSGAQLSNALEMAHLGHWEYDVANDLFTFNDPFYKIFRTTVEKVGGYTMHSAEYAHRFVHPDDTDMVGEETRKAIETTDPHFNRQIEHRMLYADGTVGYIAVRFFINKDSQGKTVKTYGVNQDITERKEAEHKLEDTLESLRKAVGTTIQVISSTVEARDPYTSGHQTRSADLARGIAMEMGLPQDKIDAIRMAGSIHDIGKISIPAEILSKPTKLSDLEFRLIQEHAQKGFEMLKDVESPWPLAEIVYQHHERMDGSGYPRNLKGEEICIEARILSVADVVEAMASHRPYRAGLGIEAALNEIEKNSGIFYDAAVADACLRLFRNKGFKLEGT